VFRTLFCCFLLLYYFVLIDQNIGKKMVTVMLICKSMHYME